jgi:hypothetical protein
MESQRHRPRERAVQPAAGFSLGHSLVQTGRAAMMDAPRSRGMAI